MFSIESFTTKEHDKAKIAFSIRQKVFVDEQHVDQREEYDSHEDESTHYLLLKEEIPVGTARWRYTDKGIKLERFAVLPEFRKLGGGFELVSRVLRDVINF